MSCTLPNCCQKDKLCSFCKEKEETKVVAVKGISEKGSRCIKVEGLCDECAEMVKPLILETIAEKGAWLYSKGLQEEV